MKLAQKSVVAYYRTKLRLLSVLSSRKAAASAFDLFCRPLRRSKRKTPAIFGKAEALSFKVDDYTISAHRWKAEGAQRVLIIHGFESASKNFERYISLLTDKKYEVVVFDAPAHGASSGKRINLPLYLKTLVKVNELYGPFDGFIAHSFGGLALAHFLEIVPHDEAVRAVLIAPATETVTTINSFFEFLGLSQKVREEFDKIIFRASGYYPEYFSVSRAIGNIRARVLWFHDEEDELTPVQDALNVKKAAHPHVSFRITRGLGHRRIYRDEKIVKEIIGFI